MRRGQRRKPVIGGAKGDDAVSSLPQPSPAPLPELATPGGLGPQEGCLAALVRPHRLGGRRCCGLRIRGLRALP
jgi:hypothetical protein